MKYNKGINRGGDIVKSCGYIAEHLPSRSLNQSMLKVRVKGVLKYIKGDSSRGYKKWQSIHLVGL